MTAQSFFERFTKTGWLILFLEDFAELFVLMDNTEKGYYCREISSSLGFELRFTEEFTNGV